MKMEFGATGEIGVEMIRTVIRFQDNVVVVFDGKGRQVPKYQGQYEKVRESVLRDASPDAIFSQWDNYETEFRVISRCEW